MSESVSCQSAAVHTAEGTSSAREVKKSRAYAAAASSRTMPGNSSGSSERFTRSYVFVPPVISTDCDGTSVEIACL